LVQTYTGSQSRIDRIYVRRSLFVHTYEWGIKTVGVDTDHRMVTVRLACKDMPAMGHGRWATAHVIRDKIFTKYLHEKGLILQANLEKVQALERWTPELNVQTLWAEFKADIFKKARERAKIIIPKIDEEIAEVELKLHLINNETELTEDERLLSSAV
ncbi:hypothetical protein C8R43DRAFT_819596, partial [Mycena crocata]